jgi:hypothetical protein
LVGAIGGGNDLKSNIQVGPLLALFINVMEMMTPRSV